MLSKPLLSIKGTITAGVVITIVLVIAVRILAGM
jgi:hypothetical protein